MADERVVRDPALDGLRAIAVLAVLAFHAIRSPASGGFDYVWQSVARAGWLGVDLFFVLSGFLITGILLDSRGLPGYFRSFYLRRVLRILPAYALTLVLLHLAVALLLPASDWYAMRFAANAAWYWTLTTNVLVALDGWSATPFFTGHLWSIGVEEQFYLLWPFVVAYTPTQRLGLRIVLLWVATIAGRLLCLTRGVDPLAIYVMPFTHADGLLAGSLLALCVRGFIASSVSSEAIRRAGIVAVIIVMAVFAGKSGMSTYMHPAHQILTYPAVAVACAALVHGLTVAPRAGALRAALCGPWLQQIGQISYGIYLFHFPIFYLLTAAGLDVSAVPRLFGSSLPGHLLLFAVGTAASIASARISWLLLEQPILRLKRLVPLPALPQTGDTAATAAVTG